MEHYTAYTCYYKSVNEQLATNPGLKDAAVTHGRKFVRNLMQHL